MMQLDWLIEGHLAGTLRPVTTVEPGADLRWLHDRGIRLLVNLTLVPPRSRECPEDLEIVHFPLEDRAVPAAASVEVLCSEILDAIIAGKPVAVCGAAGVSRTATILACCLVAWRGGAADALEAVGRLGAAYTPTQAQEQFIRDFDFDVRATVEPRNEFADEGSSDFPSDLTGPQIAL